MYNSLMMIRKGNEMFETCVSQLVKIHLGNDYHRTTWVDGTLFVECTVAEAVSVETMLLKRGIGGIIMSRVGDETAYDFV
jgi:hypothetical protein